MVQTKFAGTAKTEIILIFSYFLIFQILKTHTIPDTKLPLLYITDYLNKKDYL